MVGAQVSKGCDSGTSELGFESLTRLVMPPPRLPQPAAVALATPMMLLENICAHHVCEQTNAASEKPIRQRQTMKPVRRERDGMWIGCLLCYCPGCAQAYSPAALVANIIPMMPGVQTAMSRNMPLRAPHSSITGPMIERSTMAPDTLAILPPAMSPFDRLSESACTSRISARVSEARG